MILVQLYSLAYIEGKIKGEIAIYICGNVGAAEEVMHFWKVQERIYALPRGSQETSIARSLVDLLPPKREEDRSDLNKFKSSLYSPPFGNPSLNKIVSKCRSGLNFYQKLTHSVSRVVEQSQITASRGREILAFPQIHHPHKQFRLLKKKILAILHSCDSGGAI